jgi:hypothetical protein
VTHVFVVELNTTTFKISSIDTHIVRTAVEPRSFRDWCREDIDERVTINSSQSFLFAHLDFVHCCTLFSSFNSLRHRLFRPSLVDGGCRSALSFSNQTPLWLYGNP